MLKRFAIALCCLLFSAMRLTAQYDRSATDAWLTDNAPDMGGRVVLSVWQNDKVVYSHAVNNMTMRQRFIYSSIARKMGRQPDLADFTTSKREPIASCSKWLSAALVMTFVDEGKLSTDDTVGKFLPVLSQHGKGGITISQCLSHMTGIGPPNLIQGSEENKDAQSLGDAVNMIANLKMEAQPGKVFHYSSIGLQIAGAVLEKITGKSFEELFAQRIAGPLNMKNTDFGHKAFAEPAGGGLSTVDDYMNFLVMILNRGVFNGKRILSEKSIAEMQVNRLTPDVKIGYKPDGTESFGYGYGEWVMDGHSVSSPGLFGSFPWIDNEKKYAAFMMTYYLKKGVKETRYVQLKRLVDSSIQTR
jgi:CubicO group peptidase (beta-lactamase class C family)